jgi:hypothetical protein
MGNRDFGKTDNTGPKRMGKYFRDFGDFGAFGAFYTR